MPLSRQSFHTPLSHAGDQRRIVRKVLPGILCVAVLLCGCASTRNLKIELDSNPTTGYSWDWRQDGPGSLALVEDSFKGPSTSIPGAGGKQTFIFSGGDPGRVTLTFTYARPWEPSSLVPVDTKVFHYEVDSNGNIAESR